VSAILRTLELMAFAAIAVVALGGTAASVEATAFPSPLEGPGRPTLARSQLKPFTKAINLNAKGRTEKALKQLAKAGSGPAQQLLRLQITFDPATGEALQGLQDITESSPDYAAAWATLFGAAEGASEEMVAFEAAGRVVELWPGSSWAQEAEEMRQRLVDGLVAVAERSLETEPPEQALTAIERALEVDQSNHALLLGQADCLIRLDRLDEAKTVLAVIGDDPSALMMAGNIAEFEGDLVTAMSRYEAAPVGTPGRDEALRRVKTRWRLSVLPSYVHGALASSQVSREELAVLLVNLVPEVRAMGSGSVPLLTDILDLPSQRDIVTAARLELLSVDRVEHRFDPDRIATVAEIQHAIERLAALVGLPPPAWCGVSNVISSCMELTAPVEGKDVTDAVLNLVHGESP
jgi:tetratricopeptide (TPR) repeat protein